MRARACVRERACVRAKVRDGDGCVKRSAEIGEVRVILKSRVKRRERVEAWWRDL